MDTPVSPTAPAAPAAGQGSHEAAPRPLRQPRTITVIGVVILFVLLLGGMLALGWVPHHRAAEEAQADAAERGSDVPVVSVAHPQPSPGTSELALACDVSADKDTAIYPRAAGYLDKLHADIQDRVKAGQVLAEISAPEVDAQLEQSKASLAQSQAALIKAQTDLELAERTLARYQDMVKANTQSVTAQEFDEKRAARDQAASALAQAKANVVSAQATVQRYRVLQGFEKVVAPFDGTITARNYDLGALLSASATGPGKELFHIEQTAMMHVYVNVPQVYATNIQIGQQVTLAVRNYPGRVFQGTVARTADAIDARTRTMRVELHFPNPDGALVSGMYGQARLKIHDEHPTVRIPTSALVFNAGGVQIALVRDGKVHFQKVSVGRDLGTELEVLEGLGPDDVLITNPGMRLTEGGTVRMAAMPVAVATSQPVARAAP